MPATFFRFTTFALALLALSGCSTLETASDHAHDFAARHPVAVAVGTAIVVGGAVYALDHRRGDDHRPERIARGRPCLSGGMTECRP
jgi:hypothetical protein